MDHAMGGPDTTKVDIVWKRCEREGQVSWVPGQGRTSVTLQEGEMACVSGVPSSNLCW